MLRSSRLTALVVGAFRHVYHNSPALEGGTTVIRNRTGRLGAPLTVLALLVAGCGPTAGETRFSAALTQKGPAVSKEAVAGGKLNKFFPKTDGEWDLVYTQEKQGMAQAELKKGGKSVAQLAIFDTVSDSKVAEEYQDTKDKLDDKYPMIAKGKLGTGILVGDRFQVQVRTLPGSDFAETDRKEWLQKFDLAGLATLQ